MRNSIGIIGSGIMAEGIAKLITHSIRGEDISKVFIVTKKPDVSLMKSSIVKYYMKHRKGKKNTNDLISSFEEKFFFIKSYEPLIECNIVIEAITENLDKKSQVISDLSQCMDDEAILATNTSSLSITGLSTYYKNPENFIGLHFFNPATAMRLTEVIKGFNTSQSTLTKTIDFSKFLGKEPVVVNESPGFIVNRLLIPMINEAISLLAEGVADAKDIDAAMKLGANHPIGPLALADLIGNDVNLSIMESLYKETGDPKFRPHPLLRKMVRADCLGRKTNSGFFEY